MIDAIGFDPDPRAFSTADPANVFSTMRSPCVEVGIIESSEPWIVGGFDVAKWAECPLGKELSDQVPDQTTWELLQLIQGEIALAATYPNWDTDCVAFVATMADVLRQSAPTALDDTAAHDLAVTFIDASAWVAATEDDAPFPNQSIEVQWLWNCSAINGSR